MPLGCLSCRTMHQISCPEHMAVHSSIGSQWGFFDFERDTPDSNPYPYFVRDPIASGQSLNQLNWVNSCMQGSCDDQMWMFAWKTPCSVAWVPLMRSPMALNRGNGFLWNVLTNFALLELCFCVHIWVLCKCTCHQTIPWYMWLYIRVCGDSAEFVIPSKSREASEFLDNVILLLQLCTLINTVTYSLN